MAEFLGGRLTSTSSVLRADPWANKVAGDTDGDGKLSAAESSSFAAVRKEQAAKRAQQAEADKAAAFRLAGADGAGGYFGGRGAFLTTAGDRDRKVAGDADGDGIVSLAEKYDKDGVSSFARDCSQL